jgi:hypothetical protein
MARYHSDRKAVEAILKKIEADLNEADIEASMLFDFTPGFVGDNALDREYANKWMRRLREDLSKTLSNMRRGAF